MFKHSVNCPVRFTCRDWNNGPFISGSLEFNWHGSRNCSFNPVNLPFFRNCHSLYLGSNNNKLPRIKHKRVQRRTWKIIADIRELLLLLKLSPYMPHFSKADLISDDRSKIGATLCWMGPWLSMLHCYSMMTKPTPVQNRRLVKLILPRGSPWSEGKAWL